MFTADEWLPLFGHIKDGVIDGTMFEGATIMPSPVHVYYSGELNTREGFDAWIKHAMANAATINEAVGRVKATLGLTDYTVKLFPAVYDPTAGLVGGANRFSAWGEIDGVKMNPQNEEDGLKILQYLMDGYITAFKQAAFEHVELVGVYWFDEGLDAKRPDWYHKATALFHDRDLMVIMAPYFKSGGYDLARSFGFDTAAMQSNYFPEMRLAELNCGTIDRIDLNLDCIMRLNIGLTMEMSCPVESCVTAYKTTIKKCIEYGYTDRFHLTYFNGSLLGCYESGDEYIHSVYDDLFLYIHGKQDPEKLWIKQPQPQRTIDRQILRGFVEESMTAADWLPSVAYIKDGMIADTLFPLVSIEPPIAAVQNGELNTKAQWDAWLDTAFSAMDALEEAARQTAAALGKERCPVGLLFTLFNTREGEWGELDGERMNTTDLDHRRRMVLYLIDAYLSRAAERGYTNIGFNGFFWAEPLIRETELDWYVGVTDYICTTFGFSSAAPAYRAEGHTACYRGGFGLNTMRVDGKTAHELQESIDYIKQNSLGMELGLDDPSNEDDREAYRTALSLCVKQAVHDGLNRHRFAHGAVTVGQLAKEQAPLYDQLHAYIKHELKAD